jgi:glutamate racemase
MPDAVVFSKSCPLFVPLVKEGWTDHPVAKAVVHEYLHELQQMDIDTLVLGCTHYPLLRDLISQVMGNQVTLVDSAEAITAYLKALLPVNIVGKTGKDIFYVSDNEDKFEQIAKRILDKEIAQLRRVRLFESWFE